MRRIATALLHFPVLDRGGNVVTTAITNLDLHDIARSAHCYGLSDFFVVHPVLAQRELVCRVRDHWVNGSGGRRIPDRRAPLSKLREVPTLEDAVEALGGQEQVELWTTGARPGTRAVVTFREARVLLQQPGPPVLVVFGTGWGLADAVDRLARLRLEPIQSPHAGGFNHLSVRGAAAIVFDRLLGEWA